MNKDAAILHRSLRKRPAPPSNDPALIKLRKEAAARGATLASGGKGNLPGDLVLRVVRRAEFRCEKCGLRDDLSIHHKGRHLATASLRLLKKSPLDPTGIACICTACHDKIHDADRAAAAALKSV